MKQDDVATSNPPPDPPGDKIPATEAARLVEYITVIRSLADVLGKLDVRVTCSYTNKKKALPEVIVREVPESLTPFGEGLHYPSPYIDT